MPYELPTVEKFKLRFPEFESVTDERTQMFIDEASLFVSECWCEKDYTIAIMYRAAHMIATDPYFQSQNETGGTGGTGTTTTQSGVEGTKKLKRRKVGDVEVEYQHASYTASSSSGGLSSEMDSTPYGRRFNYLLRMNNPAIAAV